MHRIASSRKTHYCTYACNVRVRVLVSCPLCKVVYSVLTLRLTRVLSCLSSLYLLVDYLNMPYSVNLRHTWTYYLRDTRIRGIRFFPTVWFFFFSILYFLQVHLGSKNFFSYLLRIRWIDSIRIRTRTHVPYARNRCDEASEMLFPSNLLFSFYFINASDLTLNQWTLNWDRNIRYPRLRTLLHQKPTKYFHRGPKKPPYINNHV